MANWKKLASGAAGAAGGAGGLDVDDVFNVYAYTGNGTSQTITNGIDLSTEGGAVWAKQRDLSDHHLITHEAGKILYPSTAETQVTNNTNYISSFNSDGFTLGAGARGSNANNYDAVAWTFRKAPKFFDVVTYTGNGTARTIAHNLGSVPACIFVKRLNTTNSDWNVYHTSIGNTKRLLLNSNAQAYDIGSVCWNSTTPTSSVFSLGTNSGVNANGSDYVAYLFAHNDGDAEFGPTGDQDIIKCGGYTGNDTNSGKFIDLGFEPQWVVVKEVTEAADWFMVDSIRSNRVFQSGNITDNAYLSANRNNAEVGNSGIDIGFTSTGFAVSGGPNQARDYIYIAIRRGPMAVPTDAADVFTVDDTNANTAPNFSSGFPVDLGIAKVRTGTAYGYVATRLMGDFYLQADSNSGETDFNALKISGYQDGFAKNMTNSSYGDVVGYMWRRAPNFFDVVGYDGNSTSGRTVNHNLGVAPEMIWVKKRNESDSWQVYAEPLGNTKYLTLNDSSSAGTSVTRWNNTDPTETVFTLGSSGNVNENNAHYIAHLFATLNGISKVGSVSHTNGTDTDVDCGFSSGARFILIKRSSGTGSWYAFDTERGIVAGNDKGLYLQTTTAEQTADWVDPYSSGFTMVGASFDSGTYIFYAIA